MDGANGDAPIAGMPMPPYLKAANEHTLMIVQLESLIALDQAEAIARVPGVDVLMLGPGDLSVVAGIPYQFDHPIISDAYRRVSAAARPRASGGGPSPAHLRHTQMLYGPGGEVPLPWGRHRHGQ